MPLSSQQIAEAAALLEGASRGKKLLPELPAACTPTSAADAMAIQLALNRACGVRPGGWKVGFTNPAALQKVGEIGPMLGAMPAEQIKASPATFSRRDFAQPIIEFEIGYRMAADLPPRDGDYSQEEVLAAVASAIIGIEVADAHFEGPFGQPPACLIADNGVAGGFVIGPDIADWRARDLAGIAVQAFADGAPAGEGFPPEGRCDAAWVLTWTANAVAKYGEGLKAGDYITTGAAAPPAFLDQRSEWRGRFEGVGEVVVRFTD